MTYPGASRVSKVMYGTDMMSKKYRHGRQNVRPSNQLQSLLHKCIMRLMRL